MTSTIALWLTVIAVGAWHGLNPAMGWPLAVANGMAERRGGAVFATLLPLGGGHLAAMAVVLLPFGLLSGYAEWSRAIRIVAGALVLAFGLYKLARPRHPRALARIRPTQLAWWSFLMATAHGAGLMLLPFMLGLCAAGAPSADAPAATITTPATLAEAGHAVVMDALARANLATAFAVAAVHTLAMVLAGLAMAWAVYRWLGLQFLRSAWLRLDTLWGASLVLAGAVGAGMAL